jgi:hypothetical protein
MLATIVASKYITSIICPNIHVAVAPCNLKTAKHTVRQTNFVVITRRSEKITQFKQTLYYE